MNKNNYRYIDLFAGLGGFHLALEQLGGGKCVFASELKKDLQDLYHRGCNLNCVKACS